MPEKWVTLKQAALLLGQTDSSTLRRAAKAGRLRTERFGERLYMTKESWVRAWDDAREQRNDKGWQRGRSRKPAPGEEQPTI